MYYPFWRIALLTLFLTSLSPVLAGQPFVKIGWDTNPEVRVSGYNVYRSIGTEARVLLNEKELIGETHFVDRTVKKGTTYTYVVTAIDDQGLESTFSSPLTVKVEVKHLPAEQTFFLPASVAADQPAFQGISVGLGLLNLGTMPELVSLTGIDNQGAQTGYQTVADMGPLAKASVLPDQVAQLRVSSPALLGRSNSDIHSFFLAGTKDFRAFEVITEKLQPSITQYFPISLSKTGTASLTLFNPDEKKAAEVELAARTLDGATVSTKMLVLPPLGSFQGVLAEIFGPDLALEEGYIAAFSNQPIEGFQMSAFDSDSLSALPGGRIFRGQRLSLPHFFFDAWGGDTEVRVINADKTEVQLELKAYLDGQAPPEIRTLTLAPRAQAVVSMRTLLREAFPGAVSGDLELTAKGRDGAEAIYGKVVAQATFTGNGGRARAIAPLRAQAAETWIFPDVLQQGDTGFCTGLALLNQRNGPLPLTVRAFDDHGQLVAERLVEVPAGDRLVGQLDTDVFFGSGFALIGGHLEVSGDVSFMAIAFLLDQSVEFLSHIGPVTR
ncbi:MAG: fibronectin type III domain-containing protein [Acidobacteria bacterium]|nr:MAG: fibronectin type III domain-containing protein [Acidobacteriota bacterium]